MTTVVENFSGGTNGAEVTSSNTMFQGAEYSPAPFASSEAIFTNAQAHSGSLSITADPAAFISFLHLPMPATTPAQADGAVEFWTRATSPVSTVGTHYIWIGQFGLEGASRFDALDRIYFSIAGGAAASEYRFQWDATFTEEHTFSLAEDAWHKVRIEWTASTVTLVLNDVVELDAVPFVPSISGPGSFTTGTFSVRNFDEQLVTWLDDITWVYGASGLEPTECSPTFVTLNKATAAPLETGKWTYTGGNLVPTAAFRGVFAAFPDLIMGPGQAYEIEVTTTGGDPSWYDNPGEGIGLYGLLTATGNILDNPVDDGPYITGITPSPYVDGTHVITITGEEEGYLTAMAEGRQYLGVYGATSARITGVRWRCITVEPPEETLDHSPLYVQALPGIYMSATPASPGEGRLKIWTGSSWKYFAPRDGENAGTGVGKIYTASGWVSLKVEG